VLLHFFDSLNGRTTRQGCGLDVSVSRRSRLETYQRLVSVSSREKLSTSWSQPFTSCAQDQFLAKLCRPQYAL